MLALPFLASCTGPDASSKLSNTHKGHGWCRCLKTKIVPDDAPLATDSIIPVPQNGAQPGGSSSTAVRTYPDSSVYEGQILDGKRHGRGTLILPDGTKYDAEWRDDRLHGEGTETLPDGSYFAGSYEEGFRCGHGILTWPEGSRYVGQFQRGRANGEGILTRMDGSVYRGSFAEDCMSGEGVLQWKDGVVYVGQFASNRRQGRGTMKWTTGRWKSYEGEWKDGMQHGSGVLTDESDNVLCGIFSGGKLVRRENRAEFRGIDSLCTTLRVPHYWCNSDLFVGFTERRDVDPAFEDQIASLLRGTFEQFRTEDRIGSVPSELKLVKCHRVENSTMWANYIKRKARLRAKHPQGVVPIQDLAPGSRSVRTRELMDDVYGDRLDVGVNEVYLWHGTSPKDAMGISTDGFRNACPRTTLKPFFGKGCYFADCSTKSDEYAREGSSILAGIYALLLCRVVCGQCFQITHPDSKVIEEALSTGGYDSALGERRASVGTCREFVVHDQDSIYPEYVVLYERKYGRQPGF